MILSHSQIIIRLLAATMIGCLLGFERRHRGKQVGVRTHILVSVSACCIAMVAAFGFMEFDAPYNIDHGRPITGILTGIGFLGAGIIWKDNQGTIKGITTAANIWTSAVLGIIAGMGYFFLMFSALVIVFITLELSYWQELILEKKNSHKKQEQIPFDTEMKNCDMVEQEPEKLAD